MRLLGELLRDFRSKMFQKFIKPHIESPEQKREIPYQVCTFVTQADWDKFVEVRDSEDFKVPKFQS